MTNQSPRTDPDQPAPADRDWFGGRRWTGIAALGVVIVILLCVVIVLALNRGGGNKTSDGPGADVVSSASTAATGPSSPAAALPTTVPSAAPNGTVWTIYQTVALPSLPGAGPAHVDGAIATGYAHTPLGALLATANESYRYVLAPDDQWRQAAAAMLVPGTGYEAWLSIRAAHPYGSGGAAGTNSLAQIAGFQFVSYTPTDAVIQIVTKDSHGVLQVGAEHVRWDGSDWKYAVAPDGSQISNVQQVDSLAGFIEWRGV